MDFKSYMGNYFKFVWLVRDGWEKMVVDWIVQFLFLVV